MTNQKPASLNVMTNVIQAFSTSINSAAATTSIIVTKPQFHSYPKRWFVLATICLLALSNSTQWMSFASLHEAAATFYCLKSKNEEMHPIMPFFLDCDVEYWTSQIFQIIGAVTGIFGMFITDRYGIRISCFCGSFLNFFGAFIRVLSSVPDLPPQYRLFLLYTGQTVAATAQPFFLCLSPKVAEYWFPKNQRTFANALSFIANPMGIVVGSIVPVFFVNKNATNLHSIEIFYLNAAIMTIAMIVVLMSIGICSSHPPTPPSASSNCIQKPLFFQGLFLLFRKPIFYIQTVTFGMAFAIPWSFFLIADKLLTKLGYFDKVTSYLLALTALSGSLASVLIGCLVDKWKNFKETIKFCYICLAIVAVILNIFLRHLRETELDVWFLVALLIALGFFSIPIFPVSLELGIETTFPVAEATSSGILCISGQLFLIIIAFGVQQLALVDWLYKHEKANENYQLSIDFWAASTILATLFACFFLRPRYYRLEYEENTIFFSNIIPKN